jgi:hypothetical protein
MSNYRTWNLRFILNFSSYGFKRTETTSPQPQLAPQLLIKTGFLFLLQKLAQFRRKFFWLWHGLAIERQANKFHPTHIRKRVNSHDQMLKHKGKFLHAGSAIHVKVQCSLQKTHRHGVFSDFFTHHFGPRIPHLPAHKLLGQWRLAVLQETL